MYKGYQKIFWGFFIATFSIIIGFIRIPPPFVGWMVVLSGINILNEGYKTDSFELAAKLSKYLIGLSLLGELISIFSVTSQNRFKLLDFMQIGVLILELLVVYKILEGSIEYLKANEIKIYPTQYEGNLRTYTIFFVIAAILICIGITLNNSVMVIGAILTFILRISVMVMMSNLKKLDIKMYDESKPRV